MPIEHKEEHGNLEISLMTIYYDDLVEIDNEEFFKKLVRNRILAL